MSDSTERPSRKRVKFNVGDFFAVDLDDGTWGLGHIVAADATICCALFSARAPSVDALRAALNNARRQPVGLMVTTVVEIRAGRWPIVGHGAPDYPELRVPKLSGEGSGCYTVRVLAEFLEAYHGLRPWDEWPMSAVWNREILLPHLSVPPTARFQGPAQAPAPATSKPPPITDGPALVTIHLLYPGTGLPGTDLLRRRQELERRLEAGGAGEIEGAESGGGVMEVYLRTDDVRRAVPLVEKLAAELGFADDMLIETAPVDDEEGEDDIDEP